MEWIDRVGRLVQVLIGLVALMTAISQAVPALIKAVRGFRQSGTVQPSIGVGDKVAGETRLLDLAFVLLLGVLFSLFWTDALVLSGRTPSVMISGAFNFLITILMSIFLLIVWYGSKLGRGIGVLSTLTLLLLIFAPGGPFVQGEVDGVMGINLSVPVLSLVFLTMAAWFYELGYPLDRSIDIRRRIVSLLLLLGVFFIAVISLGRQYMLYIENDSKTPRIELLETREMVNSLLTSELVQIRNFYHLGSEMQLLETYRDNERVISARQASELLLDDAVGPISDKPPRIAAILEESGFSTSDAQSYTTVILSGLTEGADRTELIDYFVTQLEVSRIRAGNIVDRILEVYNEPTATTLRASRINDIMAFFSSMDLDAQTVYLSNRLQWIHPISVNPQTQSSLSMPGFNATERLTRLADYRIEFALSQQSSQVAALLGEFNYPQGIVDKFNRSNPEDRIEINTSLSEVFPNLSSTFFTPRLQEQLSAPLDYEAYLAFNQYAIVAREVITTQLAQEGVKEEQTINVFSKIEGLSPRVKDAFYNYLITDQISGLDNYNAIVLLEDIGFDPTPFLTGDGLSSVRRLVTLIETGGSLSDPQDALLRNADLVRGLQSRTDSENVLRMLRIQEPSSPVHYLLNEDLFDIVAEIEKTFSSDQKLRLFQVLYNPIQPAIQRMVSFPRLLNLPPSAGIILTDLSRTPANDREGLLHQLALALYRNDGLYSHDIFGSALLQASVLSNYAGLFIASIICSPFVIASVVLSAYVARRLNARDKLRSVIIAEASREVGNTFEIGTPAELRGRSAVISQLVSLAGRGWSSIAIVGRRGVGKTRILYELMRSYRGEKTPTAVTAWISAPSRFEEAEFVESMLERLTTNVENVIAKCLGAWPLEVRKLEARMTVIGVSVYTVFLAVSTFIFSLMTERAANSQIIGSWFSVIILVMVSLTLLLSHIVRIQPVNLTPWLERDRSNSPHAVLLYREARKTREFLDNRRRGTTSSPRLWHVAEGVRIGGAAALVLSIVVLFLLASNLVSQALVVYSVLIVAAIFIVLMVMRGGSVDVSQGVSLLSLIAEYREFVERTVYRIKKGALGERIVDDFEMVVCIDELDKIVEISEVRSFLQRMKAIFEIPGVYYYLSLSEDALNSLYLGAAKGKDEIDSAFDHIIRVPPVELKEGAIIAESYISKHHKSFSECGNSTRLSQTIAAISYGVPRDIIRRCDEVLAEGDVCKIEPVIFCDNFRRRQIQIAYSDNLLTKTQALELSSKKQLSMEEIASLLNEHQVKGGRVILSLWHLALMTLAVQFPDDAWNGVSRDLCDIGYRIPIESVDSIAEELKIVHANVEKMYKPQ